MIIYKVQCSIVTPIKVEKETKTRWIKKSGGYINKPNQNAKPSVYSFGSEHYFSSAEKAISYSKAMRIEADNALQVSLASYSDLETWIEMGMNENNLPEARQR